MPEPTVDGAARSVNPNWPPNLFTVLFVTLTRGKFALIDREDYPRIAGHSWVAHPGSFPGKWYARTYIRGSYSTGCRYAVMHRMILGTSLPEVDHWNNDGRDNRRQNLRPCTALDNHGNIQRGRGAVKYKGVSLARRGKYVARICRANKRMSLGVYATPEEAARAYDAAATKLFGEFACLNFPSQRGVL